MSAFRTTLMAGNNSPLSLEFCRNLAKRTHEHFSNLAVGEPCRTNAWDHDTIAQGKMLSMYTKIFANDATNPISFGRDPHFSCHHYPQALMFAWKDREQEHSAACSNATLADL